eukprot:6111904-Pleurochrysis_carterae.AAC.1
MHLNVFCKQMHLDGVISSFLCGSYPEDPHGRRGLAAYVAHARELLAESAASKNPFEGYSVQMPMGERQ